MKRIIAIFNLFLLCAIVICACGKDNGENSDSSTVTDTAAVTAAGSETPRGSDEVTKGTDQSTDDYATDPVGTDPEAASSESDVYNEEHNTEETSRADDTTAVPGSDTLPDIWLDDYELPFVP